MRRREFLASASLTVGALAAPGIIGRAVAQEGFTAPLRERLHNGSLIFHGGPILTMNARAPRAEAVLVLNGRIAAVGRADQIDAFRGPNTTVIDLDGRTLMPGMIDPHMHVANLATHDFVDVTVFAVENYDQAVNKIRAAAAATPPGEWVLAHGYDSVILPDAQGKIPSLAELDQLVPDHPFWMIESNGHVAYANSAGFAAAGITKDTPDPETGRYIRDANGELTGRTEEPPTFAPFLNVIPRPSNDTFLGWTKEMFEQANSLGLTSLQDLSVGLNAGIKDVEATQKALVEAPVIRYRGTLISTLADEWDRMGMRPDQGDDLARYNAVKAWSDGATQGYTAAYRENYLGKDFKGHLNYTVEALTEAIRRAHRDGWQVSVHANGDAGIDATLQAYETVLREMPRFDHRHRIEHCSCLHPEQIDKMVVLGLSPSFLIGHIRWWGKAFKDQILGEERIQFYDPAASALGAGLRVSLHSDFNVTPLGPLRCVQDAVTRLMKYGEPGEVFAPDERIPVEAGLRAVTIDAAWQCRMDDITGSIEAGKYADFAILEKDPTTVEPTELENIPVSETWLEGHRVYAA